MARTESKPAPKPVRCAVYTRKSTEEGLEQEFNSLDAQREAAEAFIASQRHEGWTLVRTRYDDGGFTGANMERPALRRLIADIDAGKIDAVVVYKVDRLSRSLIDFAKIVEIFERRSVSFVSVTQQFNTGTSLGRLVLNMLLSFAQFEREMIAERTSDKMCAARRKGRWIGGMQLLGYDVAEGGGRLVVNKSEAAQVREIFATYLEAGSLLVTAQKLNERGWRTKSWITKKNTRHEGGPWTKSNVRALLMNPTYAGRILHRGEVFAGQQPAIVDDGTFDRVQALLAHGRAHGPRDVRNSHGYLLSGLVRCVACRRAMSPATAQKRGGGRLYRYYLCGKASKEGAAACPTRSVPADELECFVLDRLKRIARDPALVEEVVARAGASARDELPALETESGTLAQELDRVRSESKRLVAAVGENDAGESRSLVARIAELDRRQGQIERRLAEIGRKAKALEQSKVGVDDVRAALTAFDPVWEVLDTRERARFLHLAIEEVAYDAVRGELAIRFHPLGLKTLAGEVPELQVASPEEVR